MEGFESVSVGNVEILLKRAILIIGFLCLEW